MALNEGKKDKRSRLYLFIMIFLLFLINLGVIYHLVTKNEEKTVQLAEKEQQLQELDKLRADLELDLQEYRGNNAKLDSIITVRDAEIEKQMQELQVILKQKNLTQQQYNQAKARITALQKEKDELTAEIARLSEENQYLKDENYVMQKQVEAERERVAEMEGVITERDREVSIGKRLYFKSLSVTPLRTALIGEWKPTDKLNKVDKLEFKFTMANNDLADKGEKTIYFQVNTPNKSVMTNASAGSGTFNYNGGDRLYTVKKVIDFQNANETATFSIPKTDGMTEGRYIVNVFSDSHVIETAEFTLR